MSALSIIAAAAMVSGSFDCQVDQFSAVSVVEGKATASMIEGLPSEALVFRAAFTKDQLAIDWPNSPIQMNGHQPVLPTGPNAGVSMFVSPGPCLFTEAGCVTMVSYARQPDGSLQFLLTPSAISTDKEHGVRMPFLVSMTGHCSVGANQ